MVTGKSYIVVQSGTFPTVETPRGVHRFKYGFNITLDDDISIYGSLEEAESNCPDGFEVVPLLVAINYMVDSAYCIK